MKGLINKILILIVSLYLFGGIVFADSTFMSNETAQPYCSWQDWVDCSLDSWVNTVSKWVNDIEQHKKFTQKVQDITSYAIWFIALLGVLYIIYAWFGILTDSWDWAKVKKSKSIITYVLLWIVVIFLAYPIINWAITQLLNTTSIIYAKLEIPSFIEQSYAYTTNDKNTFDEFRKSAESLASDLEKDYKVNGKISSNNLNNLQQIVSSAITTFPDNNDYISNVSIAKNLLISIEVVKKSPDSDAKITDMAKNLNDFLNKIKVPRISATISATPQSWNAPLNVSLRASSVLDPSWVVIPNNNFIWWIKDSSGARRTLGTWPSINYTFKEEKSYLVNLDIISSSKNNHGRIDTLPFNWQVKVDVLPSAWNVYFYVNWINVSDLDKLKITPGIGKAWLILDATASQSAAWTRFSKTYWDFGNGNTTSHDLSPHIEKQYYTNEWSYKLTLQLTTNEWKIITKNLYIEVRNPVASIGASKNSWFVWDDFKFNVNTAFYEGQLNYEWKIIALNNNETLFTSSNENISYKFRRTGKFAVKLKSRSPSWREDMDTIVVNIDSRDPVAAFDITQTNTETPNVYKFDATTSYDPDTFDSANLNFNWLVDWQQVDLEKPLRNWAVGKYTFNTEWTHKITLEVSNKDWKTTTYKKDLTVTSLLSVKLWLSPKIVKNGSPVSIVADSKEASVFEWNFWDSTTDTTNEWRVNHIYKKSWTYDLTLTVRWSKWTDSNYITRKIYVSDWVSPMASISISRDNEEILSTPNACDANDAYVIDRASAISFSAENSVNIDWTNAWLVYSWKYVWKNSSQSKLSYKFDELWCFPIDLTVKSQKNGKLNSARVYVKVENLPPKISWLTLTPTDINSDPVVVKVTANNAHDDDGVIVSYLWYYYTDSDPEPQDYRVTRTPSTTFVLPKITWKYYFVLIAEDSNWTKVNTEQLTEERYSIQLSTDNINTPLIKLTADKSSISTWDEINFDVKVNDVLWRDISDKVEYKWDFDWDWFYDETGKSWKLTHKFTTSWNINFKVKVTYKWISNTKFQLISVKNVLKPNFEYYSIWNKLVLFNTSEWNYTAVTWDLWNGITSTNLDSFVYDFSNGEYPTSVSLKISDGSNSQSVDTPVKKDVLNKAKIARNKNNLIIFSYPTIEDSTIHLQKSSDKVFLYIGESKWKDITYCIDTNISADTDLNGTTDDDCDNKWTDSYNSWLPFVISGFDKSTSSREIKITLLNGKTIAESKVVKIIIDDAVKSAEWEIVDNKNISDADRLSIEELKDLIKKAPESDRLQMMKYLSSLQENWFDEREKTKTVVDFEAYVNASWLDQKVKDEYYNLLEWFLISGNQAKSEVTLAAKVLKALIPKTNPNYDKIMKNIDEILSHPTNIVLNKDLWKFILESIKDDSNISNKDKWVIKSQLQVIIYGTQKNIPDTVKESTTSSDSGFSIVWFLLWILKIFWYIILLVVLGFVWMFIFFKTSNKNSNLSFQDFLIELFTNWQKPEESFTTEQTNNISSEATKDKEEQRILEEFKNRGEVVNNEENTNVDINKDIADFDKKNIFSSTEDNEESKTLPDWLKWSSTQEEITTANTEETTTEWSSDTINNNQELNEESIKTDENEVVADYVEPEDKQELEELSVIKEEDSNINTSNLNTNESEDDNELPAWLKWIDQDELKNEIEDEMNNEEQEVEDDQILTQTSNEDESIVVNKIIEEENNVTNNDSSINNNELLVQENSDNTKTNSNEDDSLPDWLRGSVIPESAPVATDVNDLETLVDNSESSQSSINNKVKSWKNKPKSTSDNKDSNNKSNNSHPKKSSDNKSKEDIKPIQKKPKIFTDKKPEKILADNNDDLPDWLK